MKKVLSLILAFVMIISCVAIMQVVTLADGEEIQKGIQINTTSSWQYVKTDAGYLTSELGYSTDYTGDVVLKYHVYNIGNATVDAIFDAQASVTINYKKGDNITSGSQWACYESNKSVKIKLEKGKSQLVTFTMPVVNGIVTGTFGDVKGETHTAPIKDFFPRITVTSSNASIIVEPQGTNDSAEKMLSKLGGNATEKKLFTFAKQPVSDGLFEYGFEDVLYSNIYFGTKYGGTKEIVTNETGQVHSGTYAMKFSGGTAAYSGLTLLGEALYDVVNHKAGTYEISAWYYFEKAPTDGKTKVSVNSRINSGASYNNGVETADNEIKEGEWRKHTFFINLTQDFVDNSTIDVTLSEGAGNGSIYYIDDIKIERFISPTGLTVTYDEEADGWHYFTSPDGIFNVNDAENGIITKKFVIKNNGANSVNVRVEFQVSVSNKGWVSTNGSGKVVSVAPNEEAVTSYSLPIDKDGNFTLDGTKYSVSSAFVRIDYDGGQSTKLPKGTSVTVYSESNIATAMYKKATADYNKRTFTYVTDTPISNLTLNMDVGSTLDMNWYATFAKASTAERAEVKILNNSQVKATLKGTAVGNGKYKFAFTDVAPQDMAEEYTAELWVDGVKVSKRSESIKSYCQKAMDSATDEQKTFMSDMLNYGQAFANYKNTGDVIVTEEDTWITGSDFEEIKVNLIAQKQVGEVTDTNNRITSAGLYFYNENKIYFRAVTEEDSTVKINGTETEIKNGKYYTEGIKATEFGKKFTVTVEKNGETIHSADYSVNDYILVKCDGDANINKLARALACYGNSADVVKGQ